MKGIYLGRQIKELRGRSQKITRTQTAANAYKAIVARDGEVQDSELYFHRGKGEWHKYSLANDKKRTGKLAESEEERNDAPHKWDWPGVDTKQAIKQKSKTKGKKSVKNTEGMKVKFSVSKLKNTAGLKGRKEKLVLNKGNHVLKEVPKKQSVTVKTSKPLTNKAVMANAQKDWAGRYTFLAERKDGKKEQGFEKTVAAFITSIGRRGYWKENPVVRLGIVQKDDSVAYLKSFPGYKEPVLSSGPIKVFWVHGKKPDFAKTIAEKTRLSQLKPTAKLTQRDKKTIPAGRKELIVKKMPQETLYAKLTRELKVKADKEEKEKTAQRLSGLEGFIDSMPPMQKGKVLSLLNKVKRYDGHILTTKEYIKNLVAQGYNINGNSLDNDKYVVALSKIELSFAKYLISKRKSSKFTPSQIKPSSRLAGRTSKAQPKVPHKLVMKTVEKPKARVNLQGALSKMKLKSLVGRKTKIKPDRGLSKVFTGIKGMPQKATITRTGITVTGYEDDKKMFSYTIPIAEWEKAFEKKENKGFWRANVIKKAMPKEVFASGHSFEWAHELLLTDLWAEYLAKLPTHKNHGVVKKEPGTYEYFGKDLTKGQYKDEFANMRTNLTEALKREFPDTLFTITASGRYYQQADVAWTGAPSVAAARKTGLGVGVSVFEKDMISRSVTWHNVSEKAFRNLLNKLERNKALKTRLRASYTRKLKASDLEAPKPVIKMPAKIPKEVPAAVPKKQLKGRRVKQPLQLTHSYKLKTGTPKKKMYKGFLVTGNTYPVKNQLKAVGGKWNDDEGGWVVPNTVTGAKAVNALRKTKGLRVAPLRTEENVFKRLTEAERLDKRKEKYEKKVERWEGHAGRMHQIATSREKAATDVLDNIPYGQPILIGHYTEKADRNRRDKAFKNLAKAYDATKDAENAERKAGVLTRVIDRTGTVADLKGRIVKIEKEFNHAKNKIAQAEEDLSWAKKRKSEADIKRHERDIEYWRGRVEAFREDIASLKERIPAEELKPATQGVSITMLSGIKLKPAVGATSVTKRYHNKNLQGGNFAVEVRKGNAAVELHGYHNVDGIITGLSVGPLFGGGVAVIRTDNYQTMTMSKLIEVIKRALGAV